MGAGFIGLPTWVSCPQIHVLLQYIFICKDVQRQIFNAYSGRKDVKQTINGVGSVPGKFVAAKFVATGSQIGTDSLKS